MSDVKRKHMTKSKSKKHNNLKDFGKLSNVRGELLDNACKTSKRCNKPFFTVVKKGDQLQINNDCNKPIKHYKPEKHCNQTLHVIQHGTLSSSDTSSYSHSHSDGSNSESCTNNCDNCNCNNSSSSNSN